MQRDAWHKFSFSKLESNSQIPDENNQYKTSEESFAFAREFTKFRGEYPQGEKFRWESLSHMRKRMIRVADKYSNMQKGSTQWKRIGWRNKLILF